ncbi:MAG: hypothetical protein WCW53_13405 [Syntrophales bacterium]|jgi:phenylacetate-CoA ligase
MIPRIKSFFQAVPKPIGFVFAHLPYQHRPGIGRSYTQHRLDIKSFENMGIKQQQAFVLSKIQRLLREAMHVPFYRNLYTSHGVEPEDVGNFSDITKLPIVTKKMLMETPLAERSCTIHGHYITNTGGSSGATLNFYITPRLIPIEWAHMHTIWAKLGYNQSMLKLTFAGRNLGSRSIAYDGLRHQFMINVYKGFEDILPDLRKIIDRNKIFFLHGYPSALAEFAENCDRFAPDLLYKVRLTLRGVFLGSEYPAPIYRERIESVFGVPTVSWYGHTERAILAGEKQEKFVYHPFQTYGYCEVIPNHDTGGWRLVGTSYGNLASPFIRYDTGDDVEPIEVRDGLLVSFRIRSGRVGEFVQDRCGVKIPLTALIFGRHHRIFDIAKFIQVRQEEIGEMTVIVTLKDVLPPGFMFEEWFDSSGIHMGIRFEIVDKPILSASGKVILKVQ